jgi:hypothetical protein
VHDELARARPGALAGRHPGAEEALRALGVRPRAAGTDHAGERLGGLGDDLAVSDQRGDVAEDLVGERRVVGRAEVGELLGAEQDAQPGGAAAAEQPHHAAGGDGGELVDEHERGGRLVLELGGDGEQVLDDGGGEH